MHSTRRRVVLVRAPFSYRYQCLVVHEEPILTYLLGYLKHTSSIDCKVFDFHLDRDLTFSRVLDSDATDYVLAVRETGENVHYVQRLANALANATAARIWVYGQTARLRLLNWPQSVTLVVHDEVTMGVHLGLNSHNCTYTGGLRADPYIDSLRLSTWQKRRAKAAIETTRGCHFPCKFCFINSGTNYPSRWQTRPNSAILSDIATYLELLGNNFVFYDSEFLGAAKSYHPQKKLLINEMVRQFPTIQYKIYARADTLMSFGEFDLLRKSGLKQVFIGVESLFQPDLDALGKKLSTVTILDCVASLRQNGIYVNLSFITFNRNTTVHSLRANFTALRALLKADPRTLGMPTFTFSFECFWTSASKQHVPRKATYLWKDLEQKAQPSDVASWDPALEPLMEVYRLLSYEWSKKIVVLNLSRRTRSTSEYDPIERWFSSLSEFCLDTMEHFLDAFEAGRLKLSTIPRHRDELFSRIKRFYSVLPDELANLETYAEHAGKLNYRHGVEELEEDEYWDHQIPRFAKTR